MLCLPLLVPYHCPVASIAGPTSARGRTRPHSTSVTLLCCTPATFNTRLLACAQRWTHGQMIRHKMVTW